jgi:two-component system, OmpR family, KDP operon response regulator KdpE
MKYSPPLNVMVVDDEPLIRWAIVETLEGAGYETIEAGDARTAIAAVSGSCRVDVIFLDFHLPDSDDLGLLAALRTRRPDATIILMSAYARPEVVDGAMELGAQRVVSKPFDVECVLPWVEHARQNPPTQATM